MKPQLVIRVGVAVLFACLIAAAPALAQNLVVNPEFTADLASWVPGGPGTGWYGFAGSPTPGCGMVWSTDGADSQLTQCVPIAAPGDVDFVVRHLTMTEVGLALHGDSVAFYPGPDCSGPILGVAGATGLTDLGGGWFEHSRASYPLPGGTVSALITLAAFSGPGGTMDLCYDNVRLGPAGSVPVGLLSFGAE